MEVNGQFQALATLPPDNEPRYPVDKKLGVHKSWSGRGGKEKNFFPCRKSNPDRPAHNLSHYTE
jgi:hypothetical protein